MSMPSEGYIKFDVEHRDCELPPRRFGELAGKLIAWREIMALTGLIGQEPSLYEGAGYGNLSARVGPPSDALGRRSFLITGTQTSGKPPIDLENFAVVERYDYRNNRVESYGPTRPSSEAMTHGAAYDLGPHIRAVLHAHSPVLWKCARKLNIPITDPSAPYGTPMMAEEVRRLYQSSVLPERQILAMGGHEDGMIAFGRSPEEAGQTLVTWLARAYELECDAAGISLPRHLLVGR
jgi:ribulose-5-phosphate 4-epimerase/fuculose-1-phosphate aldolase